MTNANDIGTITLNAMSFTNDGSTNKNQAFTLSGSTLALSSATITTSATTAGSAITDSIANALTLAGSNTANFGSGHNVTLSGNLSGSGSLTKSGVGSLFLTGSNSQSGTVYITDGNVRTGAGGASTSSNNYALGTGNVVVSGSGSLAIRNNSTVSNNLTIGGVGVTTLGELYGPLIGSFGASNQTAVVSGSVTLSGDATITTWASGGLTGSRLVLSGPVDIGANTLTLSRRVTAAGSTTSTVVNGAIVGSGNVIVNGTAEVYLNGVNTYTGTTTVQSGTLGGNGSIAGAVIVQNGATIASGSAANTTGALSVGSLNLNTGAIAAMAITGTGAGLYDQIVGSSSVDYGGGTLALTLSGSYATNTEFFLFNGFSSHLGQLGEITLSASGGSQFSSFTSLTRDANGNWWSGWTGTPFQSQILEFSESTGTLSVVPEPSTIVFAGIGALVLGWRRLAGRRRAARSAADPSAAV